MTKIKSNTRYVVRVQYAHGDHQRGDILSQHRTQQAADRAARKNPFAAVAAAADIDQRKE
jgi:hypothetical protein